MQGFFTKTLVAAVALLSTSAYAQPEREGWDDARVAARAMTHAPEVRRAAAALEEARSRRAYGAVSPLGNPVVGVRAMVGVPDLPAATWALVVGLPFDVAGARSRRRDEALWGEREALARLDAARNDARHRARLARVELALAEEALRIAEDRARTATALLQSVRARADAQAVTALDLSLAERDAAIAGVDRDAAARARESALGQLRDALDLGPTEAVAVTGLTPPTLPEEGVEALIRAASEARAEPRAFAAGASRLRASASRLRAESVSPLLINGEVEWQGYSQSSVGVSAQWALPITRTAQGERAEALAGAMTAAVEGRLASRALAREAATAIEVLRHALDALRGVDERVIPAAERTVTLTETLNERGAVALFRVLAARSELGAVRARRVEALREAWRARLDLDRALAIGPSPRSNP